MKLKSFILVSLLVCAGGAAFACGPWYYSAADNRIYRILPPLWQESSYVTDDFVTKNILAWSKQTGCKDTAAIRQAIYKGSLAQWDEFHSREDNSTTGLGWFGENSFVRHLSKRQDVSAIGVLYMSKLYESLRNGQRSPWYYNSRLGTDETRELRDLYNGLWQSDYSKGKYADRYTFLKIKCAWALGEDSIAVDIWKKSKLNRKGNLFYNEAMDYAARSLTRMGRQQEADALYTKNGDYTQLIPSGASLPTQLRIMLKICPNSLAIAPMLQDYLTKLDRDHAATYSWGDEEDWFLTDSMLAVSRAAIYNPDVRRKAMWRCAAACILDYKGKPKEALAMLQGAENGDGNAFLRKSVRTLTFYLRSRTEYPTEDFVKYAIGEVKWLDKEMEKEWKHLPDTTKKEEIRHILNWRWIGELNNLYSYAALRRIVLEDSVGLAWRMADFGSGVRAMQMANVAENHLIALTGNPYIERVRTSTDGIYNVWYWDDDNEYHQVWLFSPADTTKIKGKDFNLWHYTENWHDYSNGMFCLADKMDAGTLEQYRQRILRPRDGEDRWFNARGYTNIDYWQDIVGTHYLRERNYRAAALHFKYISPSYQRLMNIECHFDPFSIDRTKPSHDSTRYKYNFAHRMDSLGLIMLHETDPDRRGLAMLEYTIGLENSFGMCWWLTSYQKGWTGPALTDIEETKYAEKATAVVEQLRKKALKTLRSEDAFARYYLRLGQYGTVRKRYANTSTGQHLALVCDSWGMYQQRTNRSPHLYGPYLDVAPYKIPYGFVNIYELFPSSTQS